MIIGTSPSFWPIQLRAELEDARARAAKTDSELAEARREASELREELRGATSSAAEA